MKYLLSLIVLISCWACNQNKSSEERIKSEVVLVEHLIDTSLQAILDSNLLDGSILFFNESDNTYYSNNFDWAKEGRLPASTFKIVNSIIALDLGIVEDDSTLFPWDGKSRKLKNWEQDLYFKQAYHYSCVPCYQEIARKIGYLRMKEKLKLYEYGEMQVDSNNEDLFWLEGESKISQFQQIDFLMRFNNKELPIENRTYSIMKEMMILDSNSQYVLRGKTGWAIRNGSNNGWFVGYIESKGKAYYFATNVTPQSGFDMSKFAAVRKEISIEALKLLKIIN